MHYFTLISMLALGANANDSDMSGLFTADGIEVRADQRVFELFAVFNALGYDREDKRGPKPLQVPVYSELRLDVRRDLISAKLDLKAATEMLLAQPDPIASYVQNALLLDANKGWAPQDGAAAAGVLALSAVLKDFHVKQGNGLYEARRLALREAAKDWVGQIDLSSSKVLSQLRLPALEDMPDEDALDMEEQTRLVVVVNPLDGHGTVYRSYGEDISYIVVGPSLDAATAADVIFTEMVSLAIMPDVTRIVRKLGRDEVTKAMLGKGGIPSHWKSPESYLANLLATAFVSKAFARPLVIPDNARLPLIPAAVQAAEQAVIWYAEQKESLAELAPQLVSRVTGLKAPETTATRAQ